MLTGPFIQAKKIIDKLEMDGHQAFFVGGSVRDLILGHPIGDIDITTSAKPDQVQELFAKVIPVGIEHGTVIVRMDDISYEVTTFRTETSYTDFRHPDDVQFVNRIEEDLARRDFTINAIAMDKHGNMTDPFNGEKDISKSIIKTVGKAKERFREDPLRMMRALRFMSKLSFDIEQETRTAMKEQMYLLEHISIERIAVELEKMFSGHNIAKATNLFIEMRANQCMPLFRNNDKLSKSVSRHRDVLYSWSEMLACFHLYDGTISIKKWAKEWKLPSSTKKDANNLVSSFHYYKDNQLDNWLIYQLPSRLFEGFIRIINVFLPDNTITIDEIKDINNNLPISARHELLLNGNDIISLFPERDKGPWINDCLSQIEMKVVLGELRNDEEELKAWVKNEYYPSTSD